jgi:hypothetical protein
MKQDCETILRPYQGAGGRMSKHIFLGNDRIVTKQIALGTGENYDNADTAVEKLYTYYYHADHLGSTSVVTDHNGEVYERLEYTPYGETWLDETSGDTYFDTPYRFSAKEKDEARTILRQMYMTTCGSSLNTKSCSKGK